MDTKTEVTITQKQLDAVKSYVALLVTDEAARIIKIEKMAFCITPLLPGQIVLDLTYTKMEGGKMYSHFYIWAFDKNGNKHDKMDGLPYAEALALLAHLIPVKITNNQIVVS